MPSSHGLDARPTASAETPSIAGGKLEVLKTAFPLKPRRTEAAVVIMAVRHQRAFGSACCMHLRKLLANCPRIK
jgi:hypothetical protein